MNDETLAIECGFCHSTIYEDFLDMLDLFPRMCIRKTCWRCGAILEIRHGSVAGYAMELVESQKDLQR